VEENARGDTGGRRAHEFPHQSDSAGEERRLEEHIGEVLQDAPERERRSASSGRRTALANQGGISVAENESISTATSSASAATERYVSGVTNSPTHWATSGTAASASGSPGDEDGRVPPEHGRDQRDRDHGGAEDGPEEVPDGQACERARDEHADERPGDGGVQRARSTSPRATVPSLPATGVSPQTLVPLTCRESVTTGRATTNGDGR